MKVVKENKEEIAKVDKKYQIYKERKVMGEQYLIQLTEGMKVYEDFLKSIENDKTASANMKRYEVQQKLNELYVEYQSNLRSYHFITGTLRDMNGGKEDPTVGDILDVKQLAEEKREIESYVDCEFKPEDIEHIASIKHYTNAIKVHESLLNYLNGKTIRTPQDEVKIYETKVHLQNLEMILNERSKYHRNVFLPQYNKDMRDHQKRFKKYFKYAQEFNEFKVDLPLHEMLRQYDENKNNKQYTWQFWTTLRERIDSIILNLNENIDRLPKHMMKFTKEIK
jgi:hypothetical protein